MLDDRNINQGKIIEQGHTETNGLGEVIGEKPRRLIREFIVGSDLSDAFANGDVMRFDQVGLDIFVAEVCRKKHKHAIHDRLGVWCDDFDLGRADCVKRWERRSDDPVRRRAFYQLGSSRYSPRSISPRRDRSRSYGE